MDCATEGMLPARSRIPAPCSFRLWKGKFRGSERQLHRRGATSRSPLPCPTCAHPQLWRPMKPTLGVFRWRQEREVSFAQPRNAHGGGSGKWQSLAETKSLPSPSSHRSEPFYKITPWFPRPPPFFEVTNRIFSIFLFFYYFKYHTRDNPALLLIEPRPLRSFYVPARGNRCSRSSNSDRLARNRTRS